LHSKISKPSARYFRITATMKFISVLAFTGLTAAQVATLVSVVNQVSDSVQSLDKSVQSFNGAGDVASLQAASDKLGQTVTKGVTTVNGASTVSLTDSVNIQGQVQNLQSNVETVVNDLISKKTTIVSAGAGGQVEKSLQEQLTGAKDLQKAIASKVPTEVKSLAEQLSAGINTALQKGIDAFQGTGSAAPASGSSPSSGSSSSSSGSSSSGSSSSGSSSGSGSSAPKSNGAAAPASPSKVSGPAATSARAKPATYTGAASRNVAGSLAGAAAVFAFAL